MASLAQMHPPSRPQQVAGTAAVVVDMLMVGLCYVVVGVDLDNSVAMIILIECGILSRLEWKMKKLNQLTKRKDARLYALQTSDRHISDVGHIHKHLTNAALLIGHQRPTLSRRTWRSSSLDVCLDLGHRYYMSPA